MTTTLSETAAPAGTHEDARDPARALRRVRDDFDRDVWCLLGLPIDLADIDAAVAAIDRAVREKTRLSFVTPNVNILLRTLVDPVVRRQTLDADLCLVDGAPLVAIARMLGAPALDRVAGSDVFEALRRRPAPQAGPIKVFFFGGRDGAAEAAAKALNADHGGVTAVGFFNPGFGDVDSMSGDATIEKINAADPDFVVVSLGFLKGQAWIDRNRNRLTAPVTAHLGAVVDFTSGGVARAPEWAQRAGLEWAWRIKEEPSLWRRYAQDAGGLVRAFVNHVLPQRRLGRGGAGTACRATYEAAPAGAVVRISGGAVRGGLGEVREAFRAAAETGAPVTLDLSGIDGLDRAFLGLVLMLEKNLPGGAAAMTVAGLSDADRRLFKANKMNYANAAGGAL